MQTSLARLLSIPIFLFVALAPLSGVGRQDDAGAVVERVFGSWTVPGGLQAGDVIRSWTREPNPPANAERAAGQIASSFDLRDIELEEAPRGPITLRGVRAGGTFEWTVPPGAWSVVARPVLRPELLKIHEDAVRLRDAKDVGAAAGRWSEGAEVAKADGAGPVEAWFRARAAGELANAGLWEQADQAFENALDSAGEADALRKVRLLTTWGRTFEARGQRAEAVKRWEQALQLHRGTAGGRLEAASILHLIGSSHAAAAQLDAAAKRFEEARQIRETLAPGSLEAAETLASLGSVASRRRDLPTAAKLLNEALAIQERLVPDTLSVAWTINNLGVVAVFQGDLDTAQQRFEQALAIRQKAAPDSRDVAISLMNVGGISRDRGDSHAAEERFLQALAIAEKAGLQGLDLANLLQNIGNAAADRGHFERAEEFTRRALDIRLKIAPASLDAAFSFSSLGVIAWSRGDSAGSADYHRQALAILRKVAPASADTARTLSNLGMVAWKTDVLDQAQKFFDDALAILDKNPATAMQYGITLMNRGLIPLESGDLASAESFFTRAIDVLRRAAPDSLAVSMLLNNLGDVAQRRGQLDRSEEFHRQALDIRRAIATGTADEAQSHHALGLLARSRGSLQEAAASFQRAIDAIEAQDERLGGSQDVRAGFGASFTKYYRDLIETLIDLDRPGDAFAVLERSRARTLLAMMAQRDLVIAEAVPDLVRARRLNRAESDRVYSRLSSLNPKTNAADIQKLLGRLRELRDERHALAEKMRLASPRVAAMQYPKPLDLDRAAAAMDPGTIVLSYSIGPNRSFLFALTADDRPGGKLTVFPLEATETSLRAEIDTLRRAIHGVMKPSEASRAVGALTQKPRVVDAALTRSAARLYDVLIRPAEPLVASSTRVLLVPDGPLHRLPFAVLKPSARAAAGARYLVEWKPLHLIVSATVYDELRRNQPTRSSGDERRSLVAFGDPDYGTPPPAGAKLEEGTRGSMFAALPSTRREVNRLASLFPQSSSVFVGRAATEEIAKTASSNARYVHFATHGLVDSRFPLNSALVLSTAKQPGAERENGLLQVWEIFEQVRLNADLVTLSACETALGAEFGGEGLLGLTYAFQSAGARAVVASLWSVADDSTSELMSAFYRHLRRGKSKDDALRAAQLEVMRLGPRFAHPFHWAAFQVFGDWR